MNVTGGVQVTATVGFMWVDGVGVWVGWYAQLFSYETHLQLKLRLCCVVVGVVTIKS